MKEKKGCYMGRMKGKHIKLLAKQLVQKYASALSTDFEKNKEEIRELKLFEASKEERNKLAAEIISELRKLKRKEESISHQ